MSVKLVNLLQGNFNSYTIIQRLSLKIFILNNRHRGQQKIGHRCQKIHIKVV